MALSEAASEIAKQLELRVAMGERTNGRLLNAVAWVTMIVMGVAAISLVVTSILGWVIEGPAAHRS